MSNQKLTVLEQAEQKALVTRCKLEGIEVIGIENSLQFPINAVLDIVKPFLNDRELATVKSRLNTLMATMTNKRYAQGLFKGAPDLFIPKYHTFIEMKRRDGGKASPEQLEVQKMLRGYGYISEICHGAAVGWSVIQKQMEKTN